MAQLQLVIRCDYGSTIGWGHVVRCSALAALALQQGVHTVLVTQTLHSELPDDVQSAFRETVSVADEPSFFSWLKTKQNLPLAAIIDSHEYTTQDILHVRHNVLDSKQPLYVITDFQPEIGIDFSRVTFVYGGVYAELIRNKLTANRILSGLSYSMIRSGFERALAYAQPQSLSANLSHTSKKCVIMMGGTDPCQVTPRALEYLYKALGKEIHPIVIHHKQGKEVIGKIEKNLKNFAQHTWLEKLNTNEVAQYFLESDFAITACGGTIHELALCNLPFVGIIVADNQRPFAKGASTLWNLPIFEFNSLQEETVIAGIQKVSELKRLGFRFHPNLDTRGAKRILDSILNELRF